MMERGPYLLKASPLVIDASGVSVHCSKDRIVVDVNRLSTHTSHDSLPSAYEVNLSGFLVLG